MIELDRQKKPKGLRRRRMCFGRHVVADPEICHGKITFAGTRIFVADVLEMVAMNMDWNAIIKECHGNITREAISEAVLLAARAFLDHASDYALECVPQ